VLPPWRMAATNPRRWSKRVMETSDALDLEPGVFKLADARAIARSLQRSAQQSRRRKSDPYRSAMSMLTFYVNRAGKSLPPERLRVLQQAKEELRSLFGRAPRTPRPRARSKTRAAKTRPRRGREERGSRRMKSRPEGR
jgi:hypothetical protein